MALCLLDWMCGAQYAATSSSPANPLLSDTMKADEARWVEAVWVPFVSILRQMDGHLY